MIDPHRSCKTPLSSRAALPAALLLAGLFGLGISMVIPAGVSKNSPSSAGPVSSPAPAPDAKAPTAAPLPSAPELVSFCSRNVTERRSFVVFKRGTCVVINEPCEDPLAEARKILSRCKEAGAKFLAEPTNEGDIIVAFKDPVFQRFSPGELARLGPWLEQSATSFLTPEETVAVRDGWKVPGNARVGLLARRRVLEDAANAVPVKVIRAKERLVASR